MNDQEKLEELLEIENHPINKEITKKINKSLYRNLFKLTTFVCCLFLIFSLLLDTFQSLKKENLPFNYDSESYIINFDIIQDEISVPETSNIYIDLYKTTLELVAPNKTITNFNWILQDNNQHELNLQIEPIQRYYHISTGATNTKLTFNYPSHDSYMVKVETNEAITYYSLFETSSVLSSDIIEEIKALPDSAVIEIALTFDLPTGTNDLINLMNKYPKSLFTWASMDTSSIYSGDRANMTEGLPLYQTPFTDALAYLEKTKYPNLYLKETPLTKEELESSYFSKLNFLLDYENYLDNNNLINKEQVLAKLDQASQMMNYYGELQFTGVYAYTKKADLLKIIADDNLVHGKILDVKLSSLQK